MPYTPEQCKAFGAMASRGEKVPADWKQYCSQQQKPAHPPMPMAPMNTNMAYPKSGHK